MSAYHSLKTEFKDKDCLIAALNDMGYTEVEDHEIAQNLYGYHGDMRSDKANIIVRRRYIGSAANDLGFIRNQDGSYSSIVSEYDSGKHNTTWFAGLKAKYSERGALKVAAKNGFKYLGKSVVNGKIQMKWLDPRTV